MDFENVSMGKKESLIKQLGKIYNECDNKIDRKGFFIEEESALYEYVKVKIRVDSALSKLSKDKREFIKSYYFENNNKKSFDETFKTMCLNEFLHCLYG